MATFAVAIDELGSVHAAEVRSPGDGAAIGTALEEIADRGGIQQGECLRWGTVTAPDARAARLIAMRDEPDVYWHPDPWVDGREYE